MDIYIYIIEIYIYILLWRERERASYLSIYIHMEKTWNNIEKYGVLWDSVATRREPKSPVPKAVGESRNVLKPPVFARIVLV